MFETFNKPLVCHSSANVFYPILPYTSYAQHLQKGHCFHFLVCGGNRLPKPWHCCCGHAAVYITYVYIMKYVCIFCLSQPTVLPLSYC